MCGCYAQVSAGEVEALGVDVVSGSGGREAFVQLVLDAVRQKKAGQDAGQQVLLDDAMRRRAFESLPAGSLGTRTRAMLKVQDGCCNFCTYCIIPYARGPVRSLPLAQAVEQARALEGYREIVLTGIEVASWGRDLKDGSTFADLVESVCRAVPQLRVRLGSLEPRVVDEDFCRRLAACPNFCPQFHLSLQSGSDGVLRRMHRHYDTARYLESVRMLQKWFPGCAVTTDLIVGFPGETEEEFAESLAFARTCGLAMIHVFPYSRRAGTPAASMPGQLSRAEKADRSARAVAAAAELHREFLTAMCGTEQDGLFFPTLSGVARSINYYPIGDETPEEGVCNIALGLGKLVVDGGRTLRFSPRYPQKVLQTSTPELALRDTQNEVLALDLRPEAFRTSTDDAVNIRRLTLREVAPMRQTRFVASVWDRENDRISDSPMDEGRKVITFNAILKYNTFPLADIVRDILRLGVEEMRCPVEVEFAVNMDVPYGQQRIFNLLQIRPIIDNNDNRALDWRRVPTDDALIYARNALGVGNMNDIRDIVYVKPERFDSLSTQAIAGELDALNARMREAGRGYILVGPGRWGSSDPFLGIPVKWQQITEARVIVECGLERFRVEPSQGTHFFQNVTSLGVGYLTINPFMGDGRFDAERLGAMPAAEEGEYLRRVSFPAPLWVYIDGRSNKGIVRTEPPAGEE